MLINNQVLQIIRREKGEFIDSVWHEGAETQIPWPGCTVQVLTEEKLTRLPLEGGLRSRAVYSVTAPRTLTLLTAGTDSQSPDLVVFQNKRWEVQTYGDFPNLIMHSHYLLVKPEIRQGQNGE